MTKEQNRIERKPLCEKKQSFFVIFPIHYHGRAKNKIAPYQGQVKEQDVINMLSSIIVNHASGFIHV